MLPVTHLKDALESAPILHNFAGYDDHESAPAVALDVRPRFPKPVHVRHVPARRRVRVLLLLPLPFLARPATAPRRL
jgi:hypothetical protein